MLAEVLADLNWYEILYKPFLDTIIMGLSIYIEENIVGILIAGIIGVFTIKGKHFYELFSTLKTVFGGLKIH